MLGMATAAAASAEVWRERWPGEAAAHSLRMQSRLERNSGKIVPALLSVYALLRSAGRIMLSKHSQCPCMQSCCQLKASSWLFMLLSGPARSALHKPTKSEPSSSSLYTPLRVCDPLSAALFFAGLLLPCSKGTEPLELHLKSTGLTRARSLNMVPGESTSQLWTLVLLAQVR